MNRASAISILIALAVVFLLVWWTVLRGDEEGTHSASERSSPPADPAPSMDTPTPRLESVVPQPEPAPAVEAAPASATAPHQIPVDELVAQIKEDVEPQSWQGPNGGKIRAQGQNLVVKAEPGVQDLINEYLNKRRQALKPAEAVAELTAGERAKVRDEVQAVLGRLLAQGLRVAEVCEAIKTGEYERARTILKTVMEAEPGNAAGTWIQKALDANPPQDPCVAGITQAPWTSPMAAWARQWASKETADALTERLRRAGMNLPLVRGPERALLLQRGAVSLQATDLTAGTAVARLSVETLTDIQIDERVARGIQGTPLGDMSVIDRPLSQVLDQIVERLPGYAWRATALRILITKPDLPEERTTTIFSVADILAGDPAADPRIHLVEPPMYRLEDVSGPGAKQPSPGQPSPAGGR